MNPCYPYGGKHDFESCAFDRSAISAFRLFIIPYSQKFVNLSGRYFMHNVVKIPTSAPAAMPNPHTKGSWTNSEGASSHKTATARAGDVADDGARDAHGDEPDFGREGGVQTRHGEVGAQTARQIEHEGEPAGKESGQDIFRDQK